MNILKKFLAVALCAAVSMCACLVTGCDEEKDPNYPITIGNVCFETRPEHVAVLSTNAADIIKFLGYTDRVAVISDEVEHQGFDPLPACGSSIDPNVDILLTNGVDAVIADDNLSDATLRILDGRNINVIQMHYYNDPSDIMTTYSSIGAVFDGNGGKIKAQSAFNSLVNQLSIYKQAVNSKYKKLSLLYLSGTRSFSSVIKGSWYNNILDYSNTKVISDKLKEPKLSKTQIAKYDPYFLVLNYKTVNYLQKSSMLGSLSALKAKRYITLPLANLKLQGQTAVENVKKLVGFVDKSALSTAEGKIKKFLAGTTPVEVPTVSQSQAETTQLTATEPITTTVPETEMTKPTEKYELQSKYKVKYSSSSIATMKKNAQNDYIKAMQQRLCDLKYVAKENVTGYFGDTTESSIKAFQKKNGLSQTGKVSDALLQVLFSSDAV